MYINEEWLLDNLLSSWGDDKAEVATQIAYQVCNALDCCDYDDMLRFSVRVAVIVGEASTPEEAARDIAGWFNC